KYRHVPRLQGSGISVTTIAESPKGEIWTGYADGVIQISTFRGHDEMLISDSLSEFAISKILFHNDGYVYIATYGHGLWKWKDGQLVRFSALSNNQVSDIYDALIDPSGLIWIATDHGVWIYQPKGKSTLTNLNRQHGLRDEIVTTLLADPSGDIWMGFYDHGIGRYLNGKDTVIHVLEPNAEDGPINSLCQGFGKEIWFANEKHIGRYSYNLQTRNTILPLGIEDRIEDILFDKTGNIWMTNGNKLFMANTDLEHFLPGIKGIQSIAPADDELWIGCETGLYHFDRLTGQLTTHLRDNQLNILSVYIDDQGLLWIGTFGEGLFIYNPENNKVKVITESKGISNNSILNIDGRAQTVWLTTLGGITEINSEGDPMQDNLQVTRFQDKYNFPAGYVYDVHVGNDQKVWFGTDGKGLFCLENNQLRSVGLGELTSGPDLVDMRTIYSITSDQLDNIWISAAKGNIYKLNQEGKVIDRMASVEGSLNSLITSGNNEMVIIREGAIEIRNPVSGMYAFTSSMGLQDFSPNINATVRDRDGSVWIAGADEIFHFNSAEEDTSRYVQMHLVDLLPVHTFDEEIIRLKPDSNFLDLRFIGLWYPDPLRVLYRYKLDGHDQDWIYTQEGRAVYSKLSPGTYTFLVAGSYNEDFSKSKPLLRTIVVLPPFYFTWWFISSSAVLIILLTFLYIRGRIRRLHQIHQLEREKTNLQHNAIRAQVNPHFLFNSFNTLAGIIEEDQVAAVDYVDQLSGFFRGVLKHRDAELITIQEEITIMRNYIYILQKRHEDKIWVEENFTPSKGYIAPLTIQMLIENAIKHNKITEENPLRITVTIDNEMVKVSNPINLKIAGMVESTGFGLSSLLTRYQYLTSERVEIANDGNTFAVKIPIIHPNAPL
nr:histidine kinase [Bacteroidota bacterium]